MTLPWRRAVVLCLVIFLAACGRDEPGSPEAQIRALIDRVTAAAESGEIGPVESVLAPSFRAEGAMDRDQLLDRVRLYFLRYRRMHLLVRIESISVDSGQPASARVLLGTAARPIDSPSVLTGYRASVHRIDLRLDRVDGDWQVLYAAWERVGAGALIRLM